MPRSLTAGEIALAQSIFGNEIDYSNVNIFNGFLHIFAPTVVMQRARLSRITSFHQTEALEAGMLYLRSRVSDV
jgi:hypothetical protein